MFELLKNLFEPKKSKQNNYVYPKLSKLEKTVQVHLRQNRPARSSDLKKLVNGSSLGSVINSLRKKGYVIETFRRSKNTTYLIRNKKCH